MYASFFGLRCPPFENRADTQFFFATSECEETLAALEYEAVYGRGMALLLGEAGSGKTLLIRALVTRLNTSDDVVVVTCPPGGSLNILRETCKAFGVTLPTSETDARCLARLRRHLARNSRADRRSTLIVDQADNLGDANVSRLGALVEMGEERGKALSVVLAGQPRLRPLLDKPEFEGLRQKLYGARVLAPLTRPETERYVLHRLRVAGAGDTQIFQPGALAAVHEASEGLPRLINQICDSAMLAAFGADSKRVPRELVAEVTKAHCTMPRSADVRDVGVITSPDSPPWPQRDPREPKRAAMHAVQDEERVRSAFRESFSGAGGLTGEDYGGEELSTSTMAATSTALLQAEGSSIIDRLEAAIARAERMAATSEATLAQHSAVERHLATLTPRAERLIEGLGKVVTQAGEAAQRAQDRLCRAEQQAEQRIATFESQVDRISETASEAAEQAKRVERGCELAGRAESNLGRFADQLSTRADAIQEQMTKLMGGIEAGSGILRKLDAGLGEACEARGEAEAAVEKIRGELKEQSQIIERRGREVCAEVSESLRTLREQAGSMTAEAKATHREAHAALQASVQRILEDQRESSGKALAEHEAKLQARMEAMRRSLNEVCEDATARLEPIQVSARGAVEAAEEALRAQNESSAKTLVENESMMQARLDAMRRSLHEVCDNATARMEPIQDRARSAVEAAATAVESAEGKLRGIVGRIEEIPKRLDSLEKRRCEELSRMRDLEEHMTNRRADCNSALERADQGLQEIEKRAGDADTALSEKLEIGERFVNDVRTNCAKIETMQHTLSALLIDVGSACERARGMREQIQRFEDVDVRMAAGLEKAEEETERISKATKWAGEIRESIEALACDVDAKLGQLDNRNSEAGRTLQQLSETAATARETLDRINDAGTAAEDAAARAHEQSTRASAAQEAAGEAAQELEEAIASACQLKGALGALASDVDGKIDRLGSHHAAASQVINTLTDATKSAHAVIEHADRTVSAARDCTDGANAKTGQLIEKVRSLTDKAESEASKLAELNAQAAELSEELGAMTRPGDELVSRLEQAVQQSRGQVDALVQVCGRATELAECAPELIKAVETAKEMKAAFRNAIEAAEGKQAELAKLRDEAEAACKSLRGAGSSYGNLIERHEALKKDAEKACQRLGEQLEATGLSLEAGESLLKEFVMQSQGIGGELAGLHKKAAAVAQSIENATAKPNQIIVTAQAHAAQLERVCASVRKVFSGLAQTTLDARKQMDELRRSSAEVGHRLAQLTHETDRSSNTMREWVAEAMRVQSRLDNTLKKCPPIGATHPQSSLAHMARVTEPLHGGDYTVPAARKPSAAPNRPEPTLEEGAMRNQPKRPLEPAGADERGAKVRELAELVERAKQGR